MNAQGNSNVGSSAGSSQGVSRRDVLKGGLYGAAGLMLGGRLAQHVQAAETAPPKPQAKAKAVIQIWLWGGPPHTDTFDPKPDAGYNYCGPLDKAIPTNVPGILIGSSLPLLAQQADKYSIIRSMTHGNNGHETAAYIVQTGRKEGGRDVFPCIGAVVSLFRGYAAGYSGLLPPYIVLTQPQGRFSEGGFLGGRYKPFATGGNPAAREFVVEGVVAPGISRDRQRTRRDLMHSLDPLRQALKDDPRIAAMEKSEQKAYDLILGEAGAVFDLTQEKEELRELYGPNTLGQACLAARRLVEKGVPYVTVNAGGWDTHKEHFKAMASKLPQLDRAFSTLLIDLAEKKLLDSTIVWCGGEFGRTPKVDWGSPWNSGRHHFGSVFSHVVAGGGFKGGCVVGASDEKGENVKERPVYPWDLLASMYELLGIDPNAKLPHPRGTDIRVTPTAEEGYTIGGRLREIM